MRHIVCQVRDSHSYLAEFIAYHHELVDKIWLIDHKSNPPLSILEADSIRVFRLSTNGQHQGEAVSIVSRHIKNSDPKGWIYILDIDEFLPFISYKELDWFEAFNRNNAVLGFNWKNGICPGHTFRKSQSNFISDYPYIIFTPILTPIKSVSKSPQGLILLFNMYRWAWSYR